MPLFGATMFLSAFLLFLIQPLLGKYILPWFGGTPAVWNTCMLFFQAVLLGGYGYAHLTARRWPLKRQALVHLCLVFLTALAVLWFSILPSPAWKPADDQSPIPLILGLLLISIGAPYLLLSSTAPLLQSWFSRMHPGRVPYRLYALSNLGSLLAILSYPFLIEPEISLRRQASIWSRLYAAFALMCTLLALKAWKSGAPRGAAEDPGLPESGNAEERPGAGRYLLWLSLTACSSAMLLATTSTLCQDLAVVPLLWILPLGIYLLTFILCFQYERLYWRPLFVGGLAVSLAWTCFVMSGGVFVALRWQILSYSLTLFASCMVCHGELVRLKPATRHLTSFYLMVAAGGVLGGLLVSVAAPYLLAGFWEYHLGLLVTVLLTLLVLFCDRTGPLRQGPQRAVWLIWGAISGSWALLALIVNSRMYETRKFQLVSAAILLMMLTALGLELKGKLAAGRRLKLCCVWAMLCISWGVLAFALHAHIRRSLESCIAASRNFFGVMRVLELYKDDPQNHVLSLMHGRIEHGYQYQDPEKRRWRVSYYGPESGIGLALRLHPRRIQGDALRIGVIGLGTGTLATYGETGDTIRFYEINPQVLQVSDQYFTYRKDSRARIDVVLGDARISLERARQQGISQTFDMLVVDAFSSDAIPVHLLTRECYEMYRYHLKEDGILAIHITNRFFDLSPIVRNLIVPGPGENTQALLFHNLGDFSMGVDRTDWVLLTSNRRFLDHPEVQASITPWSAPAPPSLFWTDDYSNLFRLVHERIYSGR
jgi:hypothetical protein